MTSSNKAIYFFFCTGFWGICKLGVQPLIKDQSDLLRWDWILWLWGTMMVRSPSTRFEKGPNGEEWSWLWWKVWAPRMVWGEYSAWGASCGKKEPRYSLSADPSGEYQSFQIKWSYSWFHQSGEVGHSHSSSGDLRSWPRLVLGRLDLGSMKCEG